jgi:CHASE2 domain-containing sensor protein
MANATNEIGPEARATAPRELAAILRSTFAIALTLLFVWLLDSLGAVASFDEGLRRLYVTLDDQLGASRESSEAVVVVAGDRETVAAWGPPPWPPERLAALVEQIDPGQADVIVELGHTRMFVGGDELAALREGVERGELLIGGLDSPDSPWAGVGLERGELRLRPASRLVELGQRSERLPAVPERLPVRWLTPRSRLPMVPAHLVAAGKIPPRTFAQRVVVLGVTDPAHAMPVATPLGPMSPVEVEAHALTALADGAVWTELPLPAIYVGCGLLAFALLWMLKRGPGTRVAVVLLAGLGVLLVVDFVGHAHGWLRLGAGHALVTAAVIALSHWVGESLEASIGLRRLRARVLDHAAGVAAHGEPGRADDPGLWRELATLGTEYAEEIIGELVATATTVLERERGTYRLQVRASAKLDEHGHAVLGATVEHLDLRQPPLRVTWLTLRANMVGPLVPGAGSALVVPIEHRGELLGLWMVHFAAALELGQDDRELFEDLARQMAAALVRRRERSALRRSMRANVRDHVETIISGFRLLRDEQRWALELLEQLPVRAMIATVWGELEYVDPRLRSELGNRYPGVFTDAESEAPADNLRSVLARVTGNSLAEAHRLMRKVVRTGVELELAAAPGVGVGDGDDVWVLTRIRSTRGLDLPGFRPATHDHIVLMARSYAPARTIATASGRFLRVLGTS